MKKALWLFMIFATAFMATCTAYAEWETPTAVIVSQEGGQTSRIGKYGDNVYVLSALNRAYSSNGKSSLKFYKSTDGGKSFDAGTILGDDVMNETEIEMKAGLNGYIHVFWENSTDDILYYRRSTDNGNTFSSSVALSSDMQWANAPRCFIENTNTIYLIFCALYGTTKSELYFVKSTNGGASFGSPIRVTNNSIQEDNPKICVFNGVIYVTYLDYYSTQNLYLIKSTNGGTSFGSPVRVNRTDKKTDFGFDMAIYGNGNIFVPYKDTVSDSEGDLYVARSKDAGNSFDYKMAADSTSRYQEYPRITVFNDIIYLGWYDYRQENGEVYLTRSTDGSESYETNFNVSSSSQNQSITDLVADTNGVYILATDYGYSPYATKLYMTAPIVTPTPTPTPTPIPTPSDITAPSGSVSINSGASYTNSTTVTLTLSATDNVGVTDYYISNSSTIPSASASDWTSITSTASYTGSILYTLSGDDGGKTVYAWYKDATRNVSNTSSDSIVLDTTAPTVTITSPTSDSTHTTSGNTISLGGSASDSTSGVNSVTWSNSKGGNGTASGTTSWTISSISLSSGDNVITVTAIDGVGNTGTDIITVKTGIAPTPTPTVSPCTDSYEPNDSFSTAYGLLISGTSYNGKICSSSDLDYFKMTVDNLVTISLTLNVPSNRDYDLYLYNSSQSLVANSTAAAGITETITYSASTTGTYYIQVFGYSGAYDVSQTYTLSGTWAARPTPTATPTPVFSPTSQPTLSPLPTPSPITSPSPVKGAIFGVVNDQDNIPLKGVVVTIIGSGLSGSTITDENGFYTFSELAAGDYKLTYEKEGYITKTQNITLKEGETLYLGIITMEISKSNIFGSVVDTKGNPIESVRLTLTGVRTSISQTTSSDADGFFKFLDLDADTYVIFAKKKAYKRSKQTVRLGEHEDKEIEIVMKKIRKKKAGMIQEH